MTTTIVAVALQPVEKAQALPGDVKADEAGGPVAKIA